MFVCRRHIKNLLKAHNWEHNNSTNKTEINNNLKYLKFYFNIDKSFLIRLDNVYIVFNWKEYTW